MVHIVYKITNLINNKIYVGKHSSNQIDDEYMGSGKLIQKSIKKYGIENFKKEILFQFNDEKDAYNKEKEIVNEDFISRKDTYNLIIGGDSFESINSNIELRKRKNKKAAQSMNKIIWKDEKFVERHKKRVSELFRKLNAEGKMENGRFDWTNKKHKEESKKKIGIKNSISQKGQRNSQFGTCWIYHNELGNKKIKKSDVELYLTNGWIKGRKIK